MGVISSVTVKRQRLKIFYSINVFGNGDDGDGENSGSNNNKISHS